MRQIPKSGGTPRLQGLARGPFVYRVDAADCIEFVSSAWLEFADVNGAPELTADAVIGRPLASFIAGDETRALYGGLFERVRAEEQAVRVPFRCDSPDVRRFMELHVAPRGGGAIECAGRLLRIEHRAPVTLLDSHAPRSSEIFSLCSNCKLLHLGGEEWVEVEEGIDRMALTERLPLPSLRHGLCPACFDMFQASLGAARG